MVLSAKMGDIMETIEINKFKNIPSGENFNQTAVISEIPESIEYEILSENENLEYIDYLNLTKVIEVLAEFFDVHAAALAKDAKLCTAALGSSVETAFEKIIENDPLSLTAGTIGFSKEVTLELAMQIKAMNIKNIISTKYSKEAVEYLQKHTEMNIVEIKSPLQELLGFNTNDIKVTPFGYLIQEQNSSKLTKSSFKVAGKVKPSQQQAEDAIFAWKLAKYTASNSAVIVKDLAAKAIVQSAINLADAVECAMDIACENSKDAVLAVDGVIEGQEIINAAIQGRIGLIIEAGDGINSQKIKSLADKYNISIIHTGIRNYRYWK